MGRVFFAVGERVDTHPFVDRLAVLAHFLWMLMGLQYVACVRHVFSISTSILYYYGFLPSPLPLLPTVIH